MRKNYEWSSDRLLKVCFGKFLSKTGVGEGKQEGHKKLMVD